MGIKVGKRGSKNKGTGLYPQRAHWSIYARGQNPGCFLYLLRRPFARRLRHTRPELDRAEIVARISALADDTRLQMLQMIAENGEMRSQEIMEAIGLSQPSVSRYLSQLTAAGYLQERRANGGKVYILNRDRIEKTLKAVSAFLLDRS